MLWQVSVELLSCLRKWESAGRMAAADVQASFNDILGMFVLRMPTVRIFEISFDLRSRFSLSHWDSLLLAAAKEALVDVFYSVDMAAGASYDGVRVVNPFV